MQHHNLDIETLENGLSMTKGRVWVWVPLDGSELFLPFFQLDVPHGGASVHELAEVNPFRRRGARQRCV